MTTRGELREMNEANGLSRHKCRNGGCEGCDYKSGGASTEPSIEVTQEQFSTLKRATGMHMSRSGRPYRNSLRCAAASRQYQQALELCRLGLMARAGGATNSSAQDGVAELARFEVTNAGAQLLGVGSARELTRDAE